MISVARVLATWRSASRSVWTYCFMVKATSAWPMRWLSAFQSIFASQHRRRRMTQIVIMPTSAYHDFPHYDLRGT